jgi:hypothetical protein
VPENFQTVSLGTSVNTSRPSRIHWEFIGVCHTGGKTKEEERWLTSTPSCTGTMLRSKLTE